MDTIEEVLQSTAHIDEILGGPEDNGVRRQNVLAHCLQRRPIRYRDLVRNRALVAVMYDAMCGRSELVALNIEDLGTGPESGGSVTVRRPKTDQEDRSKTDQEGQGSIRYIAHDALQHPSVWFRAAGIDRAKAGPLFRSVREAGRIGDRLSDNDVARIVKRMAKAAGLAVSPRDTRAGWAAVRI